MKLHFGKKIAIFYSLFVIFLVTMVYRSTQQQFDLVVPNYYEVDLKYQEVIDAAKNANSLTEPVKISKSQLGIEIHIPQEAGRVEKGVIEFYKPDNASQDFRVQLAGNEQTVARSMFRTGKYVAKMKWESGGKTYYKEETLFL